MPGRRARMLTESSTSDSYQVPIRAVPPAQPRFASEMRAAPTSAPPAPSTPPPPPATEPVWAHEPGAADVQSPSETEDFWDDAAAPFEEEQGSAEESQSYAVAPQSTEKPSAPPELLPVPASVFDDDFFRTDRVRARVADTLSTAAQAPRIQIREPEIIIGSGTRTSGFNGAPVRDYTATQPAAALFAGASGSGAAVGESDELDIPAFLRGRQ